MVDQRIRRRFAGIVADSRKQLGLGLQLDMALYADSDLVLGAGFGVDHGSKAPRSLSAWRKPASASRTSFFLSFRTSSLAIVLRNVWPNQTVSLLVRVCSVSYTHLRAHE